MKDLPGYIYRQTKAKGEMEESGIFPLAFCYGNGIFETAVAQKVRLYE
jgi:hypothetical protein